jgi:hypothetical protein
MDTESFITPVGSPWVRIESISKKYFVEIVESNTDHVTYRLAAETCREGAPAGPWMVLSNKVFLSTYKPRVIS